MQLSLIPLLLSIKLGLYLNIPTFWFFYRMQKCNIILIALTKKISLFFLSFLKRIVILIRQLVDTADSQIDPLSYDFVEWLLFDSSRSYHLEALLLFGICPLRPLYAHWKAHSLFNVWDINLIFSGRLGPLVVWLRTSLIFCSFF